MRPSNHQVNWKIGSPHAARLGLAGFDGLVALYREYRALCDAMLAALPIPALSLHNNGDWQRIYTIILAFLGLPCDVGAPPAQ